MPYIFASVFNATYISVVVVCLLTPGEHRPSKADFQQIWYPLVLDVTVI